MASKSTIAFTVLQLNHILICIILFLILFVHLAELVLKIQNQIKYRNTPVMKNSRLNFKNQMSNFALIASVTLFAIFSCTPAQNDSGQKHKNPAMNQNQVQQNAIKAASAEDTLPKIDDQAVSQTGDEIILNPPHGQPGHRCEIPVGSPLNSSSVNAGPKINASTSSPATPSAIRNNPTAPTIQNANRLKSQQSQGNSPPPTGTKPANNPPHGQPWHRCDIPVGNPLP
jgi:hypothetical protein